MDESGNRDNGRHKLPQGQWLMQHPHQHQPPMKQMMAIMAERDAAIQERNLALSEKKAALAERDMAILQRDSAIAERNNAIMERDNAMATLHYRENSLSGQIPRVMKPMHMVHHQHPHMGEHMHMNEPEPIPVPLPAPETVKPPRRNKRVNKEPKAKTPKVSKKVKKENEETTGVSDDLLKSDWKDQDLGLNQVPFDETTMSVPVCSCTGELRPCYKWGSGGWQSSCCTTNLSMYPLPAVPNKRHARIGGRKMSGGAFTKLLSRLAAEGHDLSNPVDLKNHWAKHGTNRYITIK